MLAQQNRDRVLDKRKTGFAEADKVTLLLVTVPRWVAMSTAIMAIVGS